MSISAARLFAILICFLIIVSSALPVKAEDSTVSATAKKQLIQQKINLRQGKIDSRIENIQEKAASRAAALKTKLQSFKNRTKAVIAERINNNLNMINQNQTSQMQKHLSSMSNILDKLGDRVNKSSADIKDPAAIGTAIIQARETIATVSAAVSTQAQKDYTISVTSEARIKTDVKTQRDKLHADLLALRGLVVEAKRAVGNTVRAAKSGPKTGDIEAEEGTGSGQQ